MNKIIGIILIVAGLLLGYRGVQTVSKNDASVKVLGMKIDASNESGKTQGFMYLGAAILMFFGGVYVLGKKDI